MRVAPLLLASMLAAGGEQETVCREAVARLEKARKGFAEAAKRHAALDARTRDAYEKALASLRSDAPTFAAFEEGMGVVDLLLAEMRRIDERQAAEKSLHAALTAEIGRTSGHLWRKGGTAGRRSLLEEAEAALDRIEKARVPAGNAGRVAEALEAAVASPLFDAQVEIVRAITLGLRDLTALDALDREGADEELADLRFLLRDAAFALMHDGCDLIEVWRREG